MLPGDLVQQLKSENDHLQVQLEDLNYMIEAREEELTLLRKTAAHAVQLQSRLDQNLFELEQMQLRIGEEQQEAKSANKREASLEEEMIQSLKMEKEYYDIRDRFNSTKTALADINSQMAEAVALYREVAELKSKLAEMESNLEIAALDNRFLKEELVKYREETAYDAASNG